MAASSLCLYLFSGNKGPPPNKALVSAQYSFSSTLGLDKRYRIDWVDSVDIWLKNQVLLGMEQRRLGEQWKEHGKLQIFFFFLIWSFL